MVLTIFTACGPNKKMLASKNQIKQLQKDSVDTHRKLDVKNANAKNVAVAKKKPPVVYNTKKYVPLPPEKIETIFKSKYPSAREVLWVKKDAVKLEGKNGNDYKVNFLLDDHSNSVTYASNGEVIETRDQIVPDQLPQNIIDAIHAKYPDYYILTAGNIRSTKTKEAFTVVIRTVANPKLKEVILMENGAIVE